MSVEPKNELPIQPLSYEDNVLNNLRYHYLYAASGMLVAEVSEWATRIFDNTELGKFVTVAGMTVGTLVAARSVLQLAFAERIQSEQHLERRAEYNKHPNNSRLSHDSIEAGLVHAQNAYKSTALLAITAGLLNELSYYYGKMGQIDEAWIAYGAAGITLACILAFSKSEINKASPTLWSTENRQKYLNAIPESKKDQNRQRFLKKGKNPRISK